MKPQLATVIASGALNRLGRPEEGAGTDVQYATRRDPPLGGDYTLPMRLPALMIAFTALFFVAGCKPKTDVAKDVPQPTVKKGWKTAKIDGMPATVSVPEDFSVERGPAVGTVDDAKGLTQNLPSLVAIRQAGENVESISVTAIEAKDALGEKDLRDSIQGFVDSFKAQGHGVSDFATSVVDLPIGRAQKGRFAMTLAKGDGHTTAYFLADGKRMFGLSITTADASKIDHDEIAKSLRIGQEPAK